MRCSGPAARSGCSLDARRMAGTAAGRGPVTCAAGRPPCPSASTATRVPCCAIAANAAAGRIRALQRLTSSGDLPIIRAAVRLHRASRAGATGLAREARPPRRSTRAPRGSSRGNASPGIEHDADREDSICCAHGWSPRWRPGARPPCRSRPRPSGGTATYREHMALPPEAQFEASVEDAAHADAAAAPWAPCACPRRACPSTSRSASTRAGSSPATPTCCERASRWEARPSSRRRRRRCKTPRARPRTSTCCSIASARKRGPAPRACACKASIATSRTRRRPSSTARTAAAWRSRARATPARCSRPTSPRTPRPARPCSPPSTRACSRGAAAGGERADIHPTLLVDRFVAISTQSQCDSPVGTAPARELRLDAGRPARQGARPDGLATAARPRAAVRAEAPCRLGRLQSPGRPLHAAGRPPHARPVSHHPACPPARAAWRRSRPTSTRSRQCSAGASTTSGSR